MLDINFIREKPERVKEGMQQKGETDTEAVDRVLELDREWRNAVTRLDERRAENNRKARQIGEMMGKGEKEEANLLIRETSQAKEEIKELEEEMRRLGQERDELLLRIPNIPDSSVPVGSSEEENREIHRQGEIPDESWRKPHWELTSTDADLDFKRGVKVAGTGFPFYTGGMARLQRALIQYFLDRAIEAGYLEIEPPFVVNEASARGTGQIPDKEDMMYVISRDGLMLIPTAEVPVTNFLRDEILDSSRLPLLYVAYTPCWRREAGSYGKDVRGLNRLHQFNKVELVKVVRPDESDRELEELRSYVEGLLESLGLTYRTLLMCTGDMGFTQSKKYDMEVWSSGQDRWLEVSSCSNFNAYQARRLQLRYRDSNGNIEMLHTLNGSALALPRVMAALLESGQDREGTVHLPEPLHLYMGRTTLV